MFSDLEIKWIHQKINNEQDSNTISDKTSINEQKQPDRNEPPTSENRNTTQLNNTQPNNLEQTLTQEQNVSLENLKGIMNGEKTNLLSLRNIEWRTIKTETKKINQVLPYVSTNNITKLNEVIYVGGGGISLWENWDPLKKHEEKNQNQDGKFNWKRK